MFFDLSVISVLCLHLFNSFVDICWGVLHTPQSAQLMEFQCIPTHVTRTIINFTSFLSPPGRTVPINLHSHFQPPATVITGLLCLSRLAYFEHCIWMKSHKCYLCDCLLSLRIFTRFVHVVPSVEQHPFLWLHNILLFFYTTFGSSVQLGLFPLWG